jgi:hypothetical protein
LFTTHFDGDWRFFLEKNILGFDDHGLKLIRKCDVV